MVTPACARIHLKVRKRDQMSVIFFFGIYTFYNACFTILDIFTQPSDNIQQVASQAVF